MVYPVLILYKKVVTMLKFTRVFAIIFLIASAFSCSQRNARTADADVPGIDSLALRLKELNLKIASDPNNDKLYLERANVYLLEGKTDSALRDVFFAIDINDQNPDHYVALADVYLAMGNPDKSMDGLNKSLQIDPVHIDALLRKGRLYMIMRNYQQCYQTIDQLLQIDQVNPVAYFVKGFAHLEQGDTTAAIRNFRIAAEQDQAYFDPYLQLGMVYSAMKNPLAAEYLKIAINLRPMALEPYYQLALFFQENGNVEKAIKTYENILKIDPLHQFSLYNLGYINLVYLQDFEKGADYFTQVTEINPQYAEAFYNRGYCFELSGNPDQAKKDYQKTLEIEVNYQKAIDGLNRLEK